MHLHSRNSLNLLKGVLYARSSRLIPDKANLGFRFLVTDLVVVEHVKFLLGTMYSWVILDVQQFINCDFPL
jgi:hypothetical protein